MRVSFKSIRLNGSEYADQYEFALAVLRFMASCFLSADAADGGNYWQFDDRYLNGDESFEGVYRIYCIAKTSRSTPAFAMPLSGVNGESLWFVSGVGLNMPASPQVSKALASRGNIFAGGKRSTPILPCGTGILYNFDSDITLIAANDSNAKTRPLISNDSVEFMPLDAAQLNAGYSSDVNNSMIQSFNQSGLLNIGVGVHRNQFMFLYKPTAADTYKISIGGRIFSPFQTDDVYSSGVVFFPAALSPDTPLNADASNVLTGICAAVKDARGVMISDVESCFKWTGMFAISPAAGASAVVPWVSPYILSNTNISRGALFKGFVDNESIRFIGVPTSGFDRGKNFNGGRFMMINAPVVDLHEFRCAVVIPWHIDNVLPPFS